MGQEYDGRIDNIGLPDSLLFEVSHSVTVGPNLKGKVKVSAEYASGSKLKIDIDLFERYFGEGEDSDVPVIKYSTKSTAPAYCGELRLKTPNYYRTLELETPGLHDPMEGCRSSHQWGNGSELVISSPEDGRTLRFNASGANVTDSCFKTFLYCTSLGSDSNRFNRENANALLNQDYTHGSLFRSSKELAQLILAKFAATIGRGMLDVAEPQGDDSIERTCAWIVHGPVEYLPETGGALPGIKSLFTKSDIDVYRNQNEYRFWLGFRNTPAQSDEAEILLPVPEEIVTAVALE